MRRAAGLARQQCTATPARSSSAASVRACTDLPAPSPPSSVMKRPRARHAALLSRRRTQPSATSTSASKARRASDPCPTEALVFSGSSSASVAPRNTCRRADLDPLGDGRDERPGIDDLGEQPVGRAVRHEDLGRLRAGKLDAAGRRRRRPRRSPPCRRLGTARADRRRGSRSRTVLRASSARSVAVFTPFITTISRCPSSIAEPTSPKPPSAESPAIRPSAPMPIDEQRIAVQLMDLVPGEILLAEIFVVVGISRGSDARRARPCRAPWCAARGRSCHTNW